MMLERIGVPVDILYAGRRRTIRRGLGNRSMSLLRGFPIFAVSIWVALAPSAAAQVVHPVDRRADGRLLDANNQVGVGGFNAPRHSAYPNAAGLTITGNVTGGRAFRGFSPIRDASSLLLSLPTSQMGGFQRDSIGVGDVVAGRSQSAVSPFFLPSSTAAGLGALWVGTPQTAPGTMGRAFAVPRVDLFTGKPWGFGTALDPGRFVPSSRTLDPRFLPRQTITDTPLARGGKALQTLRLAESPLFGLPGASGFESPDLSAPGRPDFRAYVPGAISVDAAGARRGGTPYRSSLLEHLFETGAPRSPSELAPTLFGLGPMSTALREDTAQVSPGPRGPSPSTTGSVPAMTTPIGGERGQEGALASEPGWPTPQGTAEFVPTRQSVYEDFRQAVQWSDAYAADLEALPEGVAGDEAAPTGKFDVSRSYVRRLLEEAPKSFAGVVESDVNVRIRRAEALMQEGRFYAAAAQYAIAITLAPNDPLILLGKGHAHLAAGDYLSAVYYLTMGLERFPEVAHFKLDLYDFVGDPISLDIRRADLDAKLERRGDYRLRFLLGYAEYYGGLKEFGLLQLQLAAEEAPADSVIARFPKMLEAAETKGQRDEGTKNSEL